MARYERAVVAHVAGEPGAGLAEIRRAVKAALGTASNEKTDQALDRLIGRYVLRRETSGKAGSATRHFVTDPPATDRDPFGPS